MTVPLQPNRPRRGGAYRRRPKAFFDPHGSLPETVELELSVPPGFAFAAEFRALLSAALHDLEQKHHHSGWAFDPLFDPRRRGAPGPPRRDDRVRAGLGTALSVTGDPFGADPAHDQEPSPVPHTMSGSMSLDSICSSPYRWRSREEVAG